MINNKIKNIPVYICVGIVSIFALLPFYMMIVMGTYINEDLFTGVKLLPGSYLWENLKTVVGLHFLTYYNNSLMVALIHTVGGVFVSALTGYAFAKYRFKFQNGLFFFILGTLMIPPQLGLVGFVVEMKWLGMTNTLWPLILPGMATPFGVFWMTQYIASSVPDEIIESAKIDGCNDFRIFLQIVIPVIRPALVTIFLLFFLWSWNNYLTPLVIINRDSLYTVPLAISMIGNEFRTDFAARILALTISSIPIIILFAFGSKQLIRGLTAGSVKG